MYSAIAHEMSALVAIKRSSINLGGLFFVDKLVLMVYIGFNEARLIGV
jgi:hypothetical protein